MKTRLLPPSCAGLLLSLALAVTSVNPCLAREEDDGDGVPKVSIFAAAEAMGARRDRMPDIRDAFLRTFTSTDPKQISGILKKTGTIKIDEARWGVRAALLSLLAGADPETAVLSALGYLRELDGVHFFGNDARSMVNETLRDSMRTWAAKAPDAAMAWFRATEEGSLQVEDTAALVRLLTVQLVAGLIDADRAKGTTQLRLMKPDFAADVLCAHASQSLRSGAGEWYLKETNRLPEADRTSPLCAIIYDIYGMDPAAAAQLIKEYGTGDSCRAEMAFAAVRGSTHRAQEAGPHLAWLKKNTPASLISGNIGALYGTMGFMDYDGALKGLREALKGLDPDAGIAKFLEGATTGMSRGSVGFGLACEIKDPKILREALIQHIKSWGFFSPEEAVEGITKSAALSSDMKDELLKLVRKR